MRQNLYRSEDLFSSYGLDPAPNQKNFQLHTHSYAEILLFLQGKAIFHVEGSSYPAKPGDVFLTRPTEAHYVEVSPDMPYERIVINLDLSLLDRLDPGTPLLRPFMDRDTGQLNQYRAEDFQEPRYAAHIHDLRRHTGDRLASIADIVLCLTEIHSVFGTQKDMVERPNTFENQIIRYINNNLGHPLTLEALCERFYVSRAQFCRRFKKATGTSVGKYITIKRLLLAQQMILDGSKPSNIHSLCGFQDYSTFYRAYTKFFGHSPKEESAIPITEENYRQEFI